MHDAHDAHDAHGAPGWLTDPERDDQERYWSGSTWTDRVRPASSTGPRRLPDHVPDLQRALAAATADIDEVEERLSNLFERSDGGTRAPRPDSGVDAGEAIHAGEAATDFVEDELELPDEQPPPDAASEGEDAVHGTHAGAEDPAVRALDAALAAEEPDTGAEKRGRRFFRRRS